MVDAAYLVLPGLQSGIGSNDDAEKRHDGDSPPSERASQVHCAQNMLMMIDVDDDSPRLLSG